MLWGLATFVFLSPSLRAILGNPVRMLTLSHNAFQGGQSPDKEEVLTVQSHLAAGNALCSNVLCFYEHLFLAVITSWLCSGECPFLSEPHSPHL